MKELINNELAVTMPDGFREMTAEELEQGYGKNFDNMRGFMDEDRHVIFTITWNVTKGFFAKLTSPKELAKRAEKYLSQMFKNNGYRCNGFFESQIAGMEAQGVSYSYEVQDIPHDAETIICMRGKCCYSLYYYTRSELANSNAPLHDELFASMAFE